MEVRARLSVTDVRGSDNMSRKRRKKKEKTKSLSRKGESRGSSSTIWAACISGLALVAVALISLYGKKSEVPVIKLSKPDYRLELSRPSVESAGKVGDGLYVEPPV